MYVGDLPADATDAPLGPLTGGIIYYTNIYIYMLYIYT